MTMLVSLTLSFLFYLPLCLYLFVFVSLFFCVFVFVSVFMMRSHRSPGRPLMTMPSITLMETLQGVQGHNRTKKHQSPRKPQINQKWKPNNQDGQINQSSRKSKTISYGVGGVVFTLLFGQPNFLLKYEKGVWPHKKTGINVMIDNCCCTKK